MTLRPFSRSLPRLLRESRGIAALEFGLIAPVFFMLMLGMFDMAYTVYARAVFVGAVERAARISSLETGDTEAADELVLDSINEILPGVEIESQRRSYFDFADLDRSEQFTDTNGNDVCDNGESYVDEDGSGDWTEDVGRNDNGGAEDVVMYTVTANYEPLFKAPFMPQLWNERSFTATAIKKNQPFGIQEARPRATTTGTCTG